MKAMILSAARRGRNIPPTKEKPKPLPVKEQSPFGLRLLLSIKNKCANALLVCASVDTSQSYNMSELMTINGASPSSESA
jgi:NDP-sugar pyrophosphorylase family protein